MEIICKPCWQKPPEIIALAEFLAAQNVKTVLEIGTHTGGSAYVFAQVADRVITIDLLNQPKLYNGLPEESKITAIVADSRAQETFNIIGFEMGKSACAYIDFLFIDGDHSYEGVKRDFELYAPLIKPGGFIGFHDILQHFERDENIKVKTPIRRWEGVNVSHFWEEIRPKYECHEYIWAETVSDMTWGGIGAIKWEGGFR